MMNFPIENDEVQAPISVIDRSDLKTRRSYIGLWDF